MTAFTKTIVALTVFALSSSPLLAAPRVAIVQAEPL